MSKYVPTIGIETHVQLKTKTKLFSAVGNDASEANPNTLISHIDVGMPGALPVLNKKALELAVRTAFALNTKPQTFSKFDRKHYFYPDLPKGYQITQYEDPIIKGGHVDIAVDGKSARIGITRVHLEEDAGKNTHPTGADYSLVDLNRAGTPLLEIVSEPDMHSPAEAKAYARELYLIMKHADVSDVDLYLGHMRFDVNISVSASSEPGVRSEVKNLNSFRSVENAVAYEIKRQTELLEKGKQNVQETRGWDEAKQKTIGQRGKEEAEDYRYMPEPDIPPIHLSDEFTSEIENQMPTLPDQYRNIFKKADISSNTAGILLESSVWSSFVKSISDERGAEHAKRVSNWIAGTFEELSQSQGLVNTGNAVKLSTMVADGKLSSTAAKEIWATMCLNDKDPEKIAKERNLLQVSDQNKIDKIVAEIISKNPGVAADIQAGQAKAIGFLVGQVMTKSKGQANPELAQRTIKKQLGV